MLICFADILFFNVYISGLRTNAAKVQELFDCNLFGLSWNGTNSGTKPEAHIIEQNAEKLVPDPKMPLENWYDINLDGLSNERSILLCQETNLFYDGKLREHFKTANILCCISVFVISLGIAIITDIKVRTYLTTVLLPVLPVITITLKTIMENRKSLSASSDLKKTVLQLKLSQQDPTMQELRQVQDKIYCSRKDSALVPEWYYKWRRSRLEKAMKANADH
ncbi:S-4TM family putative pore-forming effector [Flavitalea sp. BT771]|uniref:S-4TM family putative pore-forming effector n=1 Tax=Flavitalea sp. BT771 TaxID=3063329 RepID=UPI0026E3B6BB|nr:S-4TM family putative pore-forming effector [Flavitalea sp. BT771]MDO6435608.1 S-4TM family putative pore-forming effector [Flavitalea sp. BT771]MDV6224508.1 S-4TM family putative pore-forming effector [Flavitalea sp. BT771]